MPLLDLIRILGPNAEDNISSRRKEFVVNDWQVELTNILLDEISINFFKP